MAASDRREHIRTSMNTRVKVENDRIGSVILSTRDISDGGVFIAVENDEVELEIGDRVTVQVQGLPVEAPVLDMKVVRQTHEGYGLQFAD
ncbi:MULTISPECIES: PilZ domain-containing protein [Marinobacter]|uniref:PilZ domain-containing protein n=1 Tax=Marinobacter xestospongiae TaxID=994319 RepID=A0ABU3VYB7_9GAMM|nr:MULTISPECIES: PilZ domain-containing protein [Marinobacter]MDV2079272.1 PilZ domain-containing protein [Marinobacter xestospongiae]UDL07365.1 PilZ domain-containing protein [Marinobacter sp. CA1]